MIITLSTSTIISDSLTQLSSYYDFLGFKDLTGDSCTVPEASKRDCGYMGIDQKGCEAKKCCWAEVEGSPWCYFGDTCKSITKKYQCGSTDID